MPPIEKIIGQFVTQVCFQQYYLSLHFEEGDSVMSYHREGVSKKFKSEVDILNLLGKRVERIFFDISSKELVIRIAKISLIFPIDEDGFQSYDIRVGGVLYQF